MVRSESELIPRKMSRKNPILLCHYLLRACITQKNKCHCILIFNRRITPGSFKYTVAVFLKSQGQINILTGLRVTTGYWKVARSINLIQYEIPFGGRYDVFRKMAMYLKVTENFCLCCLSLHLHTDNVFGAVRPRQNGRHFADEIFDHRPFVWCKI